MIARRRRLTRLRTTAPPTALETAKPAMLCASPVRTTYTTTVGRPTRDPRRIVDLKSTGFVSRECAGSTLRRQARAPLAAARLENSASRAGTHTETKAVRLGTLAVVRLEGPLAHGNAPCRVEKGWSNQRTNGTRSRGSGQILPLTLAACAEQDRLHQHGLWIWQDTPMTRLRECDKASTACAQSCGEHPRGVEWQARQPT
jgi:hypothetical protein